MNNKKLTARHIFKLFLLLLLAAIPGVVFFVWQYFQKPVSGEIKIIAPKEAVQFEDDAWERFEGNYFSFAHSHRYLLKSHIEDFEKSGTVLETAFFAQQDVNSKKIAIMVENIEGRTMEDTGNFLMRKKYSKVYKEEKFKIGEIRGISFATTTEAGFLEKVLFIPRGGYVAEIAFTQPIAEDGSFELEVAEVLKSIQWKK